MNMLSLPSFLKQVDLRTAAMDAGQMAALLRDIARQVPEGRRNDYLTRLSQYGPDPASPPERALDPEEGLQETCRKILEDLRLIQEGELCLEEAEPYYEYWDYGDEDEEGPGYKDPDGLLDILDQACSFVHECLDLEKYQLGYQAAKQISETQVDAEVEVLSLSELCGQNLCDINFRTFALDALYLAYLANPPDRRAEAWDALYHSLSLSETYTIALVEQERGPLPDLSDFLPRWISCQGGRYDQRSQALLREALSRTGDSACALEAARAYPRQHPELYLQYLEDHAAELSPEERYRIGQEALDRMDVAYVMRSRIAEDMARQAQALGRDEDAAACWLEAYRSNTTLTNLLRLGTEAGPEYYHAREVTSILQTALAQAGQTVRADDRSGVAGGFNRPGEDSLILQSFLTGDVAPLVQRAEQPAEFTWSSRDSGEFHGCALAVLVLLLDRGDTLRTGIRDMCSFIQFCAGFCAKDYNNGLQTPWEKDDMTLLWTCLYRWRSSFSCSEDQYEQLYLWLAKLIHRKAETVVGGQHRDEYSVCADYIAALGDAAQSRELRCKLDLLETYAARYPHHRIFLECLSRHGYRKPGKGRGTR